MRSALTPVAEVGSVFRVLLSKRGEPLAVWGWFGSVLGSSSFIHRASRSYYLFFNYLSYYLYGGQVSPINCQQGGTGFTDKLPAGGDRFHRGKLHRITGSCGKLRAGVELAGCPSDFQQLKHGLKGQTGHPGSGR